MVNHYKPTGSVKRTAQSSDRDVVIRVIERTRTRANPEKFRVARALLKRPPMNTRRLILALALTTGCAAKGPAAPQPVTRAAALQSFGGQNACQDLEQYLEDTAVQMMKTQLQQARDQIGTNGGYGVLRPGVETTATAGAPAAGASATNDAAAPAAPQDFTTTNNQVAGVDEADFVKNDGTRIFVLSGNFLHAVKSWPANEASELGKVQIDGWPRELFLDGTDKAIVFSQIWKPYPLSPAQDCAALSMSCGYYYSNTMKVSVVDVSNMAAMKVLSAYELPGSYDSARKIGASVRLVVTDDFLFPQDMKWYPDYDASDYVGYPPQPDVAKIKAKYDALIATNEALIRSQSLDTWLPQGTLTDQSGTHAIPRDCGGFSKVNAPTRLGTFSVITLNLQDGSFDQQSILSEPGMIYASQDNLYVATRHWWWWPEIGQEDATYLHKFDIQSPDKAQYVASGTVGGYPLDQFSLDEANGYLRIVTTIDTRVPDVQNPQNTWGRIQTTNRLWVFAEKNGALTSIGQSDEIAAGERVMSSRFLGDKAFVVTYRQVDPLFTFDLSDPTAPKKIGELTIPGFSTYMHPIDDTHLLTIGDYVPAPDASGHTDWTQRGLQLQIFDVSDLAHPTQAQSLIISSNNAYSEALWEHKAFNYFPAKKLLAIPFSSWDSSYANGEYWSRFTSELRVYSIDVAAGISSKGSITLADLYQAQQSYDWTYYWSPTVRRSVMADDFVYAVSDAGVRVANVSDLSTPIATAPFTHILTP
jgi:hypothetical protein